MILVVLPLRKELKLVVGRLERLGHHSQEINLGHSRGRAIPSLNLVCVTGGLGKTQFALQTQFALSHLPAVKHIVCMGSAGALTDEINVGDIVVANRIIEHDFAHQTDGNHPPVEHRVTLPNYDTKDRLFRIHEGGIASGDENIVCANRASDLQQRTQAIAIAWEGAGGARCAAFNRLPFYEIRGITDHANSETLSEFTKNLAPAMENAAKFLLEIATALK